MTNQDKLQFYFHFQIKAQLSVYSRIDTAQMFDNPFSIMNYIKLPLLLYVIMLQSASLKHDNLLKWELVS